MAFELAARGDQQVMRACRLDVNAELPGTASLESIVDVVPLSVRQVVIIGLCALVVMVDGFNTQSIAFVAPAIAAEWQVPATAFGTVFGAGLFGGLLGALFFGVLSDRAGRKPALLAAVALFALVNLLTPLATSVKVLTLTRLLAGFGLGGALPIAISLTSEYAPARLRLTLSGLMFCGFPLGAVLGGIGSVRLIPAFGWTGVFYLGGLIPVALLPFLIGLIPESVRFLSTRKARDRIECVLRQMQWLDRWNGHLASIDARMRSPVASLFTEGRATATLLLWATLFLSLLLTYFLINWIPIIARQSGIGMANAVLGVAALNLGAIVGCLMLGRLADRYGRRTTFLALAFAFGALPVGFIGAAHQSSAWLLSTAFLAGASSIGAQMCTVVYCASFYDTALRSTGVGWALGIGRIGSVVGPVVGGLLLRGGVAASTLFVLIGLMSIGSAITILVFGRLSVEEQ
jgi:AAHS family 4-hydroxybenzoate transporter-like MFS transporter